MSHLTEGAAVSLSVLLAGREARAAERQALVKKYGACVVTLTINMPGAVKLCLLSQMIFSAAQKALHDALPPPIFYRTSATPCGVEGFFVYDLPAKRVKQIACDIEDNHIIGRLMDIDVAGFDRDKLGVTPRKCLLCGENAHVCARNRTHSIPDLLHKMEIMYAEYENS